MALKLLQPNATLEDFENALKAIDKKVFNKIFFLKLAKSLGANDAKWKEQDVNMAFILSKADMDIEKAIIHYNMRVAKRSNFNGLFKFALDYAISRVQELIARGMTFAEAKAVVQSELEEDDDDDKLS